ncbi:MAG: hypothetical protein H6850_01695 [Alphaproteobacteria bacterium]|nr:MAG: hypothetical protein H6850_01695 [Alphaproteobacteria bacterium]
MHDILFNIKSENVAIKTVGILEICGMIFAKMHHAVMDNPPGGGGLSYIQ